MNGMQQTQSLCEKIAVLAEPLTQKVKLKIFGYRKFFSDGTSFNISNNFEWTKFTHEKFNSNMIPNYEDEVETALKNEKHFVLRIGEPNRQDVYLSTLYDCDVWNTLSLYKRSADTVDAFYFASTRDNYKIVTEYINNLELFEKFAKSFKVRMSEIISPQDIKKVSAITVSSKIFENHCS
jgi:hypothetical protein